MLYLIPTPIGNLQDITLRALHTFRECDYLLCEDTRRTRLLLNHYEIKVPLKSFHKFSEAKNEEKIVQDLEGGKTIGLVSDAGTPGIADPGARLIRRCREEEIEIVSLPGACAAIVALAGSGLETNHFQFVGFLPRKKGKVRQVFEGALAFPGTTICYESPFRLLSSLKLLVDCDPTCFCVVARELTKKFETYRRGRAEELLSYFSEKGVKGEIVLLIGP